MIGAQLVDTLAEAFSKSISESPVARSTSLIVIILSVYWVKMSAHQLVGSVSVL